MVVVLSRRTAWAGLIAALVACALAVPATADAAPKRIVALSPFTANTVAQLGIRPVGIGQVAVEEEAEVLGGVHVGGAAMRDGGGDHRVDRGPALAAQGQHDLARR